MRYELFMPLLLATGLSVFTIDRTTQRSQQNPQDQTTHMLGGGMMGQGQEMAGRGIIMMMGQMTTHHRKMSALMSNLMESMAAIVSEKDPEVLNSKLAEHQALLNQMYSQMMQQGKMIQMVSEQIKTSLPSRR